MQKLNKPNTTKRRRFMRQGILLFCIAIAGAGFMTQGLHHIPEAFHTNLLYTLIISIIIIASGFGHFIFSSLFGLTPFMAKAVAHKTDVSWSSQIDEMPTRTEILTTLIPVPLHIIFVTATFAPVDGSPHYIFLAATIVNAAVFSLSLSYGMAISAAKDRMETSEKVKPPQTQ